MSPWISRRSEWDLLILRYASHLVRAVGELEVPSVLGLGIWGDLGRSLVLLCTLDSIMATVGRTDPVVLILTGNAEDGISFAGGRGGSGRDFLGADDGAVLLTAAGLDAFLLPAEENRFSKMEQKTLAVRIHLNPAGWETKLL